MPPLFRPPGPRLPPCVRLAPRWRRHPVGTAALGVFALAALLTHAGARSSDHEQFHNRIFPVIDVPSGESVIIEGPAGARTAVRLIGLAAADEPAATAYARARLMGQPVRLLLCRQPTRDAEGRLLAYLEDPQTGVSHNEAILEAGWAK